MENNIANSGFILIDKPTEITSFGVVSRLRRITKIKKIGHAGTLDPFATGLLIVAIGRAATREISRFVKMEKEYVADVVFGAETDSFDREGKVIKEYNCPPIAKEKINEVVKEFVGKQCQIPPMFSAKKVNGKKLYELARKNIEIERKPSEIEIFSLEIMDYSWPNLKIKINCSSGTYIRSLAYDIGRKLECGACLKELRRTKIGDYKIEEAIELDELNEEDWQNYLLKE